MKMLNKLLICVFVSTCISACSSFSFKTDKAEVEVGDKKILVEGTEIKTEK